MSAREFFRMLSDTCGALEQPFMCRFARPVVRRHALAANDARVGAA